MNEINLKLKSYDELIFEITTLNTNKYLLEQKVNKYKQVLDKIKDITDNILEQFKKIPDKELLTNRCVDINVVEMIKEVLEEIE